MTLVWLRRQQIEEWGDDAAGQLGMCPMPTMSWEYFIRKENGLIMREFYPRHSDSPCEVKIAISFDKVKEFLKKDSVLYGVLEKNSKKNM